MNVCTMSSYLVLSLLLLLTAILLIWCGVKWDVCCAQIRYITSSHRHLTFQYQLIFIHFSRFFSCSLNLFCDLSRFRVLCDVFFTMSNIWYSQQFLFLLSLNWKHTTFPECMNAITVFSFQRFFRSVSVLLTVYPYILRCDQPKAQNESCSSFFSLLISLCLLLHKNARKSLCQKRTQPYILGHLLLFWQQRKTGKSISNFVQIHR